MENFPHSRQPGGQNTPLIVDHETQGDDAWRLARWKELQETGSMSGAIGLSPDGKIKPYPNRLFVPKPLDESEPHPYPRSPFDTPSGDGQQ